jgi:nicotinamidase-related amidase
VTSGTALLVVDMQRDVVAPGGPARVAGAEATIPRISALLEALRKESLHVLHTRRAYREDGGDVEKVRRKAFFECGGFLVEGSAGAAIVDALTPVEGEPVFTRAGWSAFQGTELEATIAQRRIRRIVMAGADLPNGVRETAYDALGLNLDVTIVRDGTSSERQEVHEANLADLARVGVKVDTCLEVIREATAGLLARP